MTAAVVATTGRCRSGWRSALRALPVLASTTLVVAAVLGGGAPAARAAATEADTAPTAAPAGAEGAPAFPLAVVPGKRYLVDAAGKPFLIHGDAAWSLIADLTREEVDLYLDDRRARGFNTLLINLLEHRFSTNAPANAYGDQPFLGRAFEVATSLTAWLPHYGTSIASAFADYAAPNEAYFAHADWVLRRAAAKGFLVMLAPSYAGWHGGTQGWYTAMVANGPDRLRQYGEYLGRRYRNFTNILWVEGGDYDPPDKDLVRAIADGIREFDPRALHTAHAAPGTSAADYWQGEPWLQVNDVYTYGPVYAAALKQYARPGRMPFFLIESAYENEHEITERGLRTQAYQAVLSGAAGQIFGNNPIWHFDGPGLYPAPVTWQQALDSPGTRSMTHLHELMAALPWWLLEPDIDDTFLTGGRGPEDAHAVAARASDRSFAIAYLPTSREITVDLGQLAGPKVVARWYDPADGRFLPVSGSPFPATGSRRLKPERASNASGFDDWALILQSAGGT
jgi:Protein of unknown function (DUF4038)/Putative collagen-binding domain of a collagenase